MLKYLKALACEYSGKNYEPSILLVEITNKCNLRCRMCDIWREKQTQEILLNKIDNILTVKPYLAIIYGGEPLLHNNIYGIIEKFAKAGIKTSLNTNGTLIDEQKAKMLSKSGLDIITFSIDGSERIHDYLRGKKGTYKKATSGIDCIRKYAPDILININFVLNKKNVDDIDSAIQLAKEKKIKLIKIIPINKSFTLNSGKVDYNLFFHDDREIEKAINKFKKINDVQIFAKDTLMNIASVGKDREKCFAGKLFFEILSDGTVLPCREKKFILGNINEKDLGAIIKDKKVRLMLEKLKNCQDCSQLCYLEPSRRMNPSYVLRNMHGMIKENFIFLRKDKFLKG